MLSEGIRVLVWSGNNDLVCSLSASRRWIYGRLNESDTGKSVTNWTSWHVEGEVGGWYESWERSTFMVVRDAGHEIAEFQPIRALSLFQRFLTGDYSDFKMMIDHVDWMGVGGESKELSNKLKVRFIGIGVAIGIGLSLLVIVLRIGWLKIKERRMKAAGYSEADKY